MKKIIIHCVPLMISLIWLASGSHFLNPIFLKGPEFLTFYLILVSGFYISLFLLKMLKETFSKVSAWFMFLILVLGLVKFTRGIILGKPVGFLLMILIVEAVGIVIFTLYGLNQKMKS